MNRALLLVLSVLAAPAVAIACTYPEADSSPSHVSPPSVEGRIVKVTSQALTVVKKDGVAHSPQVAELTVKTNIFGSGGGWVDAKDIAIGAYARVWLNDCKAYKAGTLAPAAVVVLN